MLSHYNEIVLKLFHVLWAIAGRKIYLDTIGAYYVNELDALEEFARFSKNARTSRCSTPDNARLRVSFGFVNSIVLYSVPILRDIVSVD